MILVIIADHYLIFAMEFMQLRGKSYQGRIPITGESVTEAPKRLPFFKIRKELKERVDN
jgi:nucleoid DNA-binding protein